jgi:hypothetical protein
MPSRLERGNTIELEPGKILIIDLVNVDDWEKEWLERETRASRRGLILGSTAYYHFNFLLFLDLRS